MKIINSAFNLRKDDFDFGEISGVFNLKPSGWAKIYQKYNIKTDGLTDAQIYKQLKPHLKKITGSRIYKYSASQPLQAKYQNDNPFAESSLLTTLECLGVIKDNIDSVYTDSGVYYENTIRNSLNEKYDVKKWTTFGLVNDVETLPMYVGDELIAENAPNYHQTKTGNIFNLGTVKIKANGQLYKLDLSIFGGMPDGYPTFKGNKRPFNLIEVKTKSFYKLVNEVSTDVFGQKVYTPVVGEAVRTYELIKDKTGKIKQLNFLAQRKVNEPRTLDNFTKQKMKNGDIVQLIEINGVFPQIKMNENGTVPQLFNEKQQKQYKKDGTFYVNDEGYYCQATLYTLLTYLMTHKPEKNGVYDLSPQLLSRLKVIFAVGLLAPESYIKFPLDYTVFDGKTLAPIDIDLQQHLFKVNNVETEIFRVSDLRLLNLNSPWAKFGHDNAGEIDIFGLLATCEAKYLRFFKAKQGFLLKESADKQFVAGLRNYFLNLETAHNKLKM